MKGLKKTDRVDIQVSIMTSILVVVSCLLVFLICYTLSYRDMIYDLQKRAGDMHSFLEQYMEFESFVILNEKEDMAEDVYKDMKEMLENIRQASGVRYLYTAKKREDGQYIYLVDGLPSDSDDFRNVGDPIEAEIIPELERAMAGEVILPNHIMKTSWGHIFIAYFPIHDGGKVVGAMGIEFDASHQYELYRNLKLYTPVIIIVFCIIASLIAVRLFRRISNPAYRELANTDLLTGLANRNAFNVALNNLSTGKNISSGRRAGLISIDFDGLKTVNDTMGHACGDLYLQEGSSLIQKYICSPDVLYRIGGDEFVAIILQKDEAHILHILDRIQKEVEDYNSRAKIHVSFSVGYAVFDAQKDGSLSDTLARADAMMYEEKRTKRMRTGG